MVICCVYQHNKASAGLHLSVSQVSLTCPKVYASILAFLISASTLNFPSAQAPYAPDAHFHCYIGCFPFSFYFSLCLCLSESLFLLLLFFYTPLPCCSSSLFCSCFSLLGSVDYFFSLLWTLLDASSSFLSLLFTIKTLPLHHTMDCSCHQCIHLDYVEQQKERERHSPQQGGRYKTTQEESSDCGRGANITVAMEVFEALHPPTHTHTHTHFPDNTRKVNINFVQPRI